MLFIGNFLVLTNQEKISEADRRHGEFNLLIEAPNKETAVAMFQERIVELRKKRDFFEGDCSIFLIQLLEFEGLPQKRPLMVTYKSTVGDPVLPHIGCLVPSDVNDACRIYEWENNRPSIDGQPEHLFLSFKDKAPTPLTGRAQLPG